MKINNKKGFTLVELLVSITIFVIIMATAFAQFPFLMGVIKKKENQKLILKESIELKEEFLFTDKTIAFYNYKELFDQTATQYDLENRFRRNIRDIIQNTINDYYSITNYQLNNPNVCSLPYNSDYVFSDLDIAILEDEYLLGSCLNDINLADFNQRYKILVVTDKSNLNVNIYFSYLSKLHKITSSLITDLTNDDIIFNTISSGKVSLKVYENFDINKFAGSSYNLCSNNNDSGIECSFTDYNKKQNNTGKIEIGMYKLTTSPNDINIKTSYILDTLYSLNY